MLFPRLLVVSVAVILALTVWLVGCVEEISVPRPLDARVKVLLPQTPEEVDHGWLTIDRDAANRRRMTWDGEYLESEPVALLPGEHHFLVVAVDAAEQELFRGDKEETIPDNARTFDVVIEMREVNIVCVVFPDYLDFGEISVGSTATRSFTISNSEVSTDPLAGRVSCLCPDFVVLSGGGSFSLDPGQSREVSVEFRPLALGASECFISTGTRCLDVPVMGTGIGVAAQIQPPSLDFGLVQVGETAQESFVITNTGTGDLALNVQEDCPAFSLVSGGGPTVLPPEGQRTVVVEFAPPSAGDFACTIATGEQTAGVPCNGFGAETTCDLIVASLTFQPPEPTTADEITIAAEVRNIGMAGTGAASTLQVLIPQAELTRTFTVPALAGGTGQSFQFSTTLAVAQDYAVMATADAGEVITEADETNNMTATLIGVGQAGEPECLVTPTSLSFGTVPVGEPAEEIFTVENVGQVALPIDVAAGCGDFTVVSGGGARLLAPGESLTAIVVFEPTAAGDQSCVIDVGTPCQGVTCSGTGDLPPACFVSPTVLDFGDLAVGQYADLDFTITNTGGGYLSGNVSEDCPEFTIVSGDGYFEIPGGQHVTVTVRYAPSFEGYHSCTVRTGTGLCEEVSCTGTASPAVCFDFDDGAGRQGWYLHHVLTYPSLRIFTDVADSTNLQSNWADDVDYPDAYGTDPIGNGQGSFWLDTTVDWNPIVTYPPAGDTYWLAHVRSPDLDYYPAWQNAAGFSAHVLDHLSWAGEGSCYVSIHFTVWDEDQLRERTWPDVTAPAMTVDSWGDFSVYFNDYQLPPNWHLRRVFVQIWGTIGDLYVGGAYLDEVCPIPAEKSTPPYGKRQGKGGELSAGSLEPPR